MQAMFGVISHFSNARLDGNFLLHDSDVHVIYMTDVVLLIHFVQDIGSFCSAM